MPLSVVSVGLGFVIGVVATATAVWLSQRTVRNPETTKFTSLWGLQEVVPPGERAHVVAQHVEGMRVPKGAQLVVHRAAAEGLPAEILRDAEVRIHPDVRANFCLGRDRALVFASHLHPRAYAMWTMEPVAVEKLRAEFQRLWREAVPHVEKVRLSEVAQREGRHVEVTGVATELVEFRGKRMLRLTEGPQSIGILTSQEDAAALQGSVVRAVGVVRKDATHTFLEARSLERAPRVSLPVSR